MQNTIWNPGTDEKNILPSNGSDFGFWTSNEMGLNEPVHN